MTTSPRPRSRNVRGGTLLLLSMSMLAACASAEADDTPVGAGDVSSGAAAADTASPRVIDADGTAALLADRDDVVVVDVRTPAEFASGHLAGAQLIDVSAPGFDEAIDGLDRNTTYVLYCRSGNRSAVAAARMAAVGFTDLYDAGAFDDLAAVGLPTG